MFRTRGPLIVLALLLQGNGCSSGCTVVGCVPNGLTVRLESLPASPFKVEVVVGGTVPGKPSYTYECTGGTECRDVIFFEGLMPQRATIRVTTAAGSRSTEVPAIRYNVSHPNGPNCSPTCVSASVTAQVPA